MNEPYRLNKADLQVLAAIDRLLKRLAASKSIRPAKLVSVAKVLHVLSRLPRVTEGVCVTIEISYQIKQEGCGSSSVWHLFVGEDSMALSCGGSEYTEGVGSDLFTTMTWEAQPGERTDYDGSWDESWMERDDEGYSDPAVFAEDLCGCKISIDDDDNPLLFDDDGAVPSRDDGSELADGSDGEN
jgi:hypothetical protein